MGEGSSPCVQSFPLSRPAAAMGGTPHPCGLLLRGLGCPGVQRVPWAALEVAGGEGVP